ncbi:hypothetical protein ASPZODRAFT_19651 [Penicilliopsis zonata CBS 506.65]|uniref:Uncharacterized protein n=1 Tax=Penicilliopsis zonata CBS 506.65 TaxID=1073090 RepID=A0A1L9S7X5_9EURO|nr:hypothetical protein ASPZODRAFT_19651 [Penicilliopsis zonata CBS 506.65]OJJ43247.1 hypothetical protein ASPZODRAFT_19651 [Penicilliopsis zonata CBS 506.65]
MPMNWDAQANAKLLVAILHTAKPKLDLAALAEWMGPECTDRAVSNQITKLRAMAKGTGITDSSSATSTPTKNQGEGAPKRKRATPKYKGKKGMDADSTASSPEGVMSSSTTPIKADKDGELSPCVKKAKMEGFQRKLADIPEHADELEGEDLLMGTA